MIKGQTVDLTFNMPDVTVPLIVKVRVTIQQRGVLDTSNIYVHWTTES